MRAGLMLLAAMALASAVLLGADGARQHEANVVFFGDSLTNGDHASSVDASFVGVLRARLQARGVRVTDRTAISALGGIYADLLKSRDVVAAAPSLIVVELGAHSVIEDTRITTSEFARAYGAMLDCLQGTGATVVVGTVPWLGWDPGHASYARAEGLSAVIRFQAQRRGIAVADLWDATRDRPEIIAFDGFHPNDDGHLLIADAYWREIRPRLRHAAGADASACDYEDVLPMLERRRAPDAGS